MTTFLSSFWRYVHPFHSPTISHAPEISILVHVSEWLANFTVALTDVSPWVTPPTLGPAASVCFTYAPNPPAGSATYYCGPCTQPGRYLFLTMYTPEGNKLVVCEVEVYAFNYTNAAVQ